MKMKEMISSERPREKMIEKGAAALSDGELLAVLLGNGYGEKNALDLARAMLDQCSYSLIELSSCTIERLTETKGIGIRKAAIIQACFELSRRFFAQNNAASGMEVNCSRRLYEEVMPYMKGLGHEECWCIFLNNSNHIVGRQRITSGGLDSTVIDARVITRLALEKKATSIALAHNHPSGNPLPGNADIRETVKLKEALNTMGLSLLDHIILSDGSYFSFADEQLTTCRD